MKTGTRVLGASSSAGEIVLRVDTDRQRPEEIRARSLLVAVGRKPNVEGLDLEKEGDVVGPYLFSHMAEYQAVTAIRNAFLPFRKKVLLRHGGLVYLHGP